MFKNLFILLLRRTKRLPISRVAGKREVGVVDYDDDIEEKKVSYCRKCLEYNLQVPLKNRIYPKGEPIPPDNDQFLQGHNCGLIVPIYEKKNEPVIQDFTETIDNPFDLAKDVFITIDSRKARRKARNNKDRFGDINDPDLKRELSSGQTRLISYTES
jgi:hypothetical protein